MLPDSIQRTALTVLHTTNSSMCFVGNCSDPGTMLHKYPTQTRTHKSCMQVCHPCSDGQCSVLAIPARVFDVITPPSMSRKHALDCLILYIYIYISEKGGGCISVLPTLRQNARCCLVTPRGKGGCIAILPRQVTSPCRCTSPARVPLAWSQCQLLQQHRQLQS